MNHTITIFAFGQSKGDYDRPGRGEGGLLSLISNKISNELYLVSTSRAYDENRKPLDYCISSVIFCTEKRGIIFRKIAPQMHMTIFECYRNSISAAHEVHSFLKRIVSEKPSEDWPLFMPDPVPPEGFSIDAKERIHDYGLTENKVRQAFGYVTPSQEKQCDQEKPIEINDNILAENGLLHSEIKALQYELAELKALKFEIEKEISDFARRYDEELGELFLRLLELRSESSKKRKPHHQETDNQSKETADYNEYKKNLDSRKEIKKPSLTQEELAELKKAFRMASKLCHPDIASSEKKEKANEIFVNLLVAYEGNDIKTVLDILCNLQKNGLDGIMSDDHIDQSNIYGKLESLKSEIASIRAEISKLQNSESYRVACSTKDLSSYFKIKKEEIDKEIQSLLSEDG